MVGDGRARSGPISVEAIVHLVPPAVARGVRIDAVVRGGEERDSQGIEAVFGASGVE